MFNNKKDVLLESVKKIMQESELHRKLEAELNEAYGIVSRAALPHEYVAEYDAILAEAKKTGSLPRNEKEARLAALTPPRTHVTHKDVLKGRGVIGEDEQEIKNKRMKLRDKMADPWEKRPSNQAAKKELEQMFGTKNLLNKLAYPKKLEEASLAAREKVLARSKMRSQKEERKKLGPDASSLMGTKEGEAYTQASAREAGAERGVMRRMKPSFGKNVVKEEKATEAQKAKIAKVMHKWKQGKEHIGKSEKTVPVTKEGQKQAVAIALSQAGLSKKKRMDESLESIHEEIRNSLWEKLDYVYENYGEEAAMEMYDSLSLEEQAILNERDTIPAGNRVATVSQSPVVSQSRPATPGVLRPAGTALATRTAPAAASPVGATIGAAVRTAGALSVPATIAAAGAEAAKRGTETGRVKTNYRDDQLKSTVQQALEKDAERKSGESNVALGQRIPDAATPSPEALSRQEIHKNTSPGRGFDRSSIHQQDRDMTPKPPSVSPGANADRQPTPPSEPTPAPRAAATQRSSRPAPQPQSAERPIPGSGGGSFAGQPSWARKAFNPDTGA